MEMQEDTPNIVQNPVWVEIMERLRQMSVWRHLRQPLHVCNDPICTWICKRTCPMRNWPCVCWIVSAWYSDVYYVLKCQGGVKAEMPVSTPLTPMNGVGKSRKASKVLACMMTPASKAWKLHAYTKFCKIWENAHVCAKPHCKVWQRPMRVQEQTFERKTLKD